MLFSDIFKLAATATISLLALGQSAAAQVNDGPFALYTRSDNPEWDLRVISIGARNAYFVIANKVNSPDDISAALHNFYINKTSPFPAPGADTGHLVWAAQDIYSNLFTRFDIVEPASNIQPLFGDYIYALSGYTTWFGFLDLDGDRLHNGGLTNFFAANYFAPRFNAPVVWWQFGVGTPSNTDAVPISLHRHYR